MSIDILAVLADEAPSRSAGGCKIQTWLDGIDPDQPGLDELILRVNTTRPQPDEPASPHYRTQKQVARSLTRLGLKTHYLEVGDHRARRCECGD